MQLKRNIKEDLAAFRRSPKKYIITILLGAILIALSLGYGGRRNKQITDYPSLLDETAFTVGQTSRSFREIGLYVAYEEDQVQKQALVYNPENPNSYWNTHMNGSFIRVLARNNCLQMAIHDEIFYQMAMEDGITLSEEEKKSLAGKQEDYWEDFTESGAAEKLGISREDIDATLERMIYAEKYQEIYAALQNAAVEDYAFDGEAYEELRDTLDYSYNETVWGKLKFGSLSL